MLHRDSRLVTSGLYQKFILFIVCYWLFLRLGNWSLSHLLYLHTVLLPIPHHVVLTLLIEVLLPFSIHLFYFVILKAGTVLGKVFGVWIDVKLVSVWRWSSEELTQLPSCSASWTLISCEFCSIKLLLREWKDKGETWKNIFKILYLYANKSLCEKNLLKLSNF